MYKQVYLDSPAEGIQRAERRRAVVKETMRFAPKPLSCAPAAAEGEDAHVRTKYGAGSSGVPCKLKINK